MPDGHFLKPSHYRRNIFLLTVAAVTFVLFSVSELVAALIIGSLSLLGDAIAMLVDAMSYCLNMVAERQKARLAQNLHGMTVVQQEAAELRHLKLQLYAPLISVVVLWILSIYVGITAAVTLADGSYKETDEESENFGTIFLTFSLISACVDITNLFCFYRARRIFGWRLVAVEAVPTAQGIDEKKPHANEEKVADGDDTASIDTRNEVNVNMCSAYTHVIADTLRTFSVLIAAAVAKIFDSVPPEGADAVAAIAVTLIILVSTLPLLKSVFAIFKKVHLTKDQMAQAVLEESEKAEAVAETNDANIVETEKNTVVKS